MFGLIVKDTLLVKRQIEILGFVALIFLISGIPTNNLNNFIIIIALLGQIVPITAIAYDEQFKFDKYAISMSIKKYQIVLTRYLYNLIFVGLYFIVALIIAAASNNFADQMVEFLFIISLAEFVFCITCPIIFKFGINIGRIVLFVLVFGGVTFLTIINGKSGNISILTEKTNIIIPVVALGCYFISYLISSIIYNKKEFN